MQRPDILSRVALDMHLLRILSVPIKALAGLQTDLAGVIDDWYVFCEEYVHCNTSELFKCCTKCLLTHCMTRNGDYIDDFRCNAVRLSWSHILSYQIRC